MNIILYAQTGCAITSGTIISDGINFELNTQNFLPPIVTDIYYVTDVKSSRIHCEFFGLGFEGQALGLEDSSPRNLPCSRLKDSTIF